MTTKPNIHAVNPDQLDRSQIPDPFEPENLRLDQTFTETVAVKSRESRPELRTGTRQNVFSETGWMPGMKGHWGRFLPARL